MTRYRTLLFAVLLGLCSASQSGLGVAGDANAQPSFDPLFTEHMVLQRDTPLTIRGEAAPGARLTLQIARQSVEATADQNGHWQAGLAPLAAGGPYALTVRDGTQQRVLEDILIGDVWLCAGQSNMAFQLRNVAYSASTTLKAQHPRLRYRKIDPRPLLLPAASLATRQSGWQLCTPATAPDISAVAYYFAEQLQKKTDVPLGIVISAFPGTVIDAWMPPAALRQSQNGEEILTRWQWLEEHYAALKSQQENRITAWKKDNEARFQLWYEFRTCGPFLPAHPFLPPDPSGPMHPGALYHGMIHPLTALPVRGFLWYQGESNTDRAYQYRFLLSALMQSWRQAWAQPELPFVIVQLPDYDPALDQFDRIDGGSWEVLRESQATAVSQDRHAALVVTLGLGIPNEVHPPYKRRVGLRAADAALRLAYGKTNVSEPARLQSTEKQAGSLRVKLERVGTGLFSLDGGPLRGFVVAGADQRFHPAQAELEGSDTIVVRSAKVAEPVAVRYAWAGAPLCNLYSEGGLPVPGFRSDSWPVDTQATILPFDWLTLEQ